MTFAVIKLIVLFGYKAKTYSNSFKIFEQEQLDDD